ncbi:hypothetical protein [Bacillus benzoevorans]|uniref:Uncharacterized protein n=1 Tax=Bacillus benzoevorans TaxID=1456 RepID=A0A7X0LTM2_9BACI|nr:hypothetical protein [Bacillus benzoevorans]MBB6443638.1 hypothetical protein [Bacillus benzoevorans]
MKKKNAQKSENTHVEFGMEFGDLNAAKQFEIPFMNQKKGTKKK